MHPCPRQQPAYDTATWSGQQILVIAVLMKGVLHRTFTVFQWEALVLLVAGITVNQLNYCTKDGGGEAPRHVLTGPAGMS